MGDDTDMLNIDKCKKDAKLLMELITQQIDNNLFEGFNNQFKQIVVEYDEKYMLYSTSTDLQVLESFRKWLPTILESKNLLLPLIVNKMLNEDEERVDALSLYNSIYEGTDFIPNISDFRSQFYENGGGDNSLAMITGCYWMERYSNEGLLEAQ